MFRFPKPTAPYSDAPARGWLPWGLLAPVIALLIVELPAIAASLPLQHFGLIDKHGDPTSADGLVALLFAIFGLIGLALLGWVALVERRPLATIGLGSGGIGFARGHLVGLAMVAVIVAAIWLTGGYQAGAVAPALGSPAALLWIGALLLGFALQSSVEEIVFRGWLLSAVARKLGIGVGVVLSSLLFTLLHYAPHQPWLVTANLLLFALFACSWSLRARSIWGAMGWHAGWNWLLAIGFEVPVTGIDTGLPALLVALEPIGGDWLTGGAQGPEGSLFCGLAFVIGIAWNLARSGKKP